VSMRCVTVQDNKILNTRAGDVVYALPVNRQGKSTYRHAVGDNRAYGSDACATHEIWRRCCTSQAKRSSGGEKTRKNTEKMTEEKPLVGLWLGPVLLVS
jgi:hypothetical protein